MRIKAIARVQVTLEVLAESWGEDCSIGQLYKQAAESGIGSVRKMMQNSGINARLVGDPKVLGIITETE